VASTAQRIIFAFSSPRASERSTRAVVIALSPIVGPDLNSAQKHAAVFPGGNTIFARLEFSQREICFS
jgi:hypothetical protein